jgi:hypothetical protein
MAHFVVPDLQHLQPACETTVGELPADAVKTPCPARMNPSSRTTDVFTNRNVTAFDWSVCLSFPACQIVWRGEIISFPCSGAVLPAPEDQQFQFLN